MYWWRTLSGRAKYPLWYRWLFQEIHCILGKEYLRRIQLWSRDLWNPSGSRRYPGRNYRSYPDPGWLWEIPFWGYSPHILGGIRAATGIHSQSDANRYESLRRMWVRSLWSSTRPCRGWEPLCYAISWSGTLQWSVSEERSDVSDIMDENGCRLRWSLCFLPDGRRFRTSHSHYAGTGYDPELYPSAT